MNTTAPLTAGFAVREVTPQVPLPLSGFAARCGPANGIHDPLLASVMHVESRECRFILASLDHLGLRREEIAPMREALTSTTGVPVENVWIHCTHTHGGPVQDQAYLAFLKSELCEAASDAVERTKAFSFASSYVDLPGNWFFNRRTLFSGFRPTDTRISRTAFYHDGQLSALVYSAACHPACLGPDNKHYTADWPGFVRSRIHEALGSDVPVMLLQGTSADINTGYSPGVSAIDQETPTRSYTHAERLGQSVADSLLSGIRDMRPAAAYNLKVRRDFITVPYRKAESWPATEKRRTLVETFLQQAKGLCSRELVNAAQIELAYLGFSGSIRTQSASRIGSEYSLEANIATLDGTLFAGFPGEFFVADGLAIKQAHPDKIIHCASMTNDYRGYFPPSTAYPDGGYETMVASFEPGSSESYLKTLLLMLHEGKS